jgi:hypothetical protein
MLINTKPNLNNLYLLPLLIHSFLYMKKFLFAIFLLALFVGCEKDSTRRTNNPYLPNYGFSAVLNLNLPSYSGLLTPVNPIAVTIEGDIDLLIMKVSDNQFYAWNGNCPNQTATACSKLSISGSNGKCNCDDQFLYSLFTGIGQNATYPLVNYRVEALGNNTIRVYN